MKLGLFAVGAGEAAQPEMISRIAAKAEQVGFESIFAPDHAVLFLPGDYASVYPYATDGKVAAVWGNMDLLDPFLALAWAAAHTKTLRVGIGVCVVPQRNPLITAKEVASLDVLSGGRCIFGVGIGWLKEEFRALQVPWKNRADRTREYVEAMKALWTQQTPRFDGSYCTFPRLRSDPKPVQKPHPPILVGGESDAALRRAVEVGDGWLGFNVSPEEAAKAVQRMRQLAAEIGRDFRSLEVSVGPHNRVPDVDLDALQRYRDSGVHRVVLMNPTTDSSQVDAAFEDLGERLVRHAQDL